MKRTLCGDACFVFVESTESDTIPFLFHGEPQVNRLPTAEPEGSATARFGVRDFEIQWISGGFLDFSLDFWISGFQVGFLDFKMDFWISKWISGFHSGFLDFKVDFWISKWISGFHSGFLDFKVDF